MVEFKPFDKQGAARKFLISTCLIHNDQPFFLITAIIPYPR